MTVTMRVLVEIWRDIRRSGNPCVRFEMMSGSRAMRVCGVRTFYRGARLVDTLLDGVFVFAPHNLWTLRISVGIRRCSISCFNPSFIRRARDVATSTCVADGVWTFCHATVGDYFILRDGLGHSVIGRVTRLRESVAAENGTLTSSDSDNSMENPDSD